MASEPALLYVVLYASRRVLTVTGQSTENDMASVVKGS